MKKYLLTMLLIVLFVSGCGKKNIDTQETGLIEEAVQEMTEIEQKEGAEPDWMEKEIIRPEGAEEWEEEEDDVEPEPETAEQAEGAELKAKLEEKYGFKVRNLESVSFLTYLDYEELFLNLSTTLFEYNCENAAFIECVTDSIQLSANGGRCPIIIDGYEAEEGETIYLSVSGDYQNIYMEQVTSKGSAVN